MDDAKMLNLLSVFNYVVAGLILFGYAVLITVMNVLPLSMGELGMAEKGFVMIATGIILIPSALMHILSGMFLRQRKYRIYCIIHAALQCLSIPVGLVLGVLTIMALNRESVQQEFDRDPFR